MLLSIEGEGHLLGLRIVLCPVVGRRPTFRVCRFLSATLGSLGADRDLVAVQCRGVTRRVGVQMLLLGNWAAILLAVFAELLIHRLDAHADWEEEAGRLVGLRGEGDDERSLIAVASLVDSIGLESIASQNVDHLFGLARRAGRVEKHDQIGREDQLLLGRGQQSAHRCLGQGPLEDHRAERMADQHGARIRIDPHRRQDSIDGLGGRGTGDSFRCAAPVVEGGLPNQGNIGDPAPPAEIDAHHRNADPGEPLLDVLFKASQELAVLIDGPLVRLVFARGSVVVPAMDEHHESNSRAAVESLEVRQGAVEL